METQLEQEQEQETMHVLKNDYPIEYAFFFNFSTIDNHALDNPASYRFLHKPTSSIVQRRRGAWLSSSSTAILGICTDASESHFILAIYVHGKTVEEHLISKLHFSWPLSSCGSECSIRGGRVVFASYKDSMGQMQKFAMRFMSSSDSKAFIDSLKGIVQQINKIGSANNTSEARVESETECPTLCGVHQSCCGTECLYPAVSDSQLHTLSSAGAHHVTLTSIGFSCSRANLPSSCSPESQEGGTDQLKVSPETDMFSYLKKNMPSSSFHVMLSSMMEKFINDMGGNLALQTT